MATVAVSNIFSANTSASASQVNSNFSDLVTWLNNHYNGTDTWSFMKVSSTNANPVDVTSSGATTQVSINNSATDGDPMISFQLSASTVFSMGVDDSDSDKFKLSRSASLGSADIFESTSTNLTVTGTDLNVIRNAPGSPVILHCENSDTTTGTSDARIDHLVGGSSAGDPFSRFTVTGGNAWSIGIDNSDSDALEICNASAIGSGINMRFAITTGHITPGTAGLQNFGDGTNYWADISYKTLTDRGCLPWCDDGVELADGRIVSDVNALLEIQKHPTRKTPAGLARLDYSTFPKCAYKSAEQEFAEETVERDDNGDAWILRTDSNGECTRIQAQDGVEMTMVFGVMIGAIKELALRVKTLEGQ